MMEIHYLDNTYPVFFVEIWRVTRDRTSSVSLVASMLTIVCTGIVKYF
ncbi:hypothetical protein V6Z12_D12G008700 [Gossypium hirsutum]